MDSSCQGQNPILVFPKQKSIDTENHLYPELKVSSKSNRAAAELMPPEHSCYCMQPCTTDAPTEPQTKSQLDPLSKLTPFSSPILL